MEATEISQQKLLPQDLEAEQCVLGAILMGNEALHKAIEVIGEFSFHRGAHRKIYSAMLDLFEQGEPIDLLTLKNQLNKMNALEEVGGASYLANLLNAVPNAANVRYHAKIVREKAVLRSLITAANDIIEESYRDSGDADDLLDRAERKIFAIAERKISPGFVSMDGLLSRSFEAIERLFQHKEVVTGVPTGFRVFDRMTSGLQPSELIIIAGRPSMGKTAFCLNIAQHVGADKGLAVAVFSLEMSMQQLAIRMLCSKSRVDSRKVRTGFFERADWPKLTRAASELGEAPIFIDDTPDLNVLEIKAKARRLMKEKGLKLIIVDYLQLMRGRVDTDNRQQEVAEITRSLKALAKELNVPVVVLSQLSRKVEDRGSRRPQLSDLRESGAIEQDADVVAFIYRKRLYEKKPDVDDDDAEGPASPEPGEDVAEIIIDKQRNGPTGTVRLAFIEKYTRFEDLTQRRTPF